MSRRKTTEEFIAEAREVHGDKYSYSNVEYVNCSTKVSIGCPEHGEFLQSPIHHLRNRGCPKCAGNTKPTIEEFVKKARETHGDKYAYKNVKYKNAETKVSITCLEHGEFFQTPKHHLSGHGCLKCGGRRRTTEEFVKKARVVHGGKYSYSSVGYVTEVTKVSITCPEHGEFLQSPRHHLRGQGCPECHYERGTQIYLAEFQSMSEHFAKIGIMKHDLPTRFTGVDADIVPHFINDFENADTAREVEQGILQHLRSEEAMYRAEILEGNGSTETFELGYLPDIRNVLEECAKYTRKNEITREKVVDMCLNGA